MVRNEAKRKDVAEDEAKVAAVPDLAAPPNAALLAEVRTLRAANARLSEALNLALSRLPPIPKGAEGELKFPIRNTGNETERGELLRTLADARDVPTARRLLITLKAVLLERGERLCCPTCGKTGSLLAQGGVPKSGGRLSSLQFLMKHSKFGEKDLRCYLDRNIVPNIEIQARSKEERAVSEGEST